MPEIYLILKDLCSLIRERNNIGNGFLRLVSFGFAMKKICKSNLTGFAGKYYLLWEVYEFDWVGPVIYFNR